MATQIDFNNLVINASMKGLSKLGTFLFYFKDNLGN